MSDEDKKEKLVNPFRTVFNRMLETFAEHQWKQLLRSWCLAMRDEQDARMRVVLELAVELDRIKKVSNFGTAYHERIIAEIIQGDWRGAAETDRLMLAHDEPDAPEHNERYRQLWETFRAILMSACAEAKRREAGEPSEGN